MEGLEVMGMLRSCVVRLVIVLASIVPANSQNVVVGSGYSAPLPVRVAPGQVLTFFIAGLGAGVKTEVGADTFPLPRVLAGISATFRQGAEIPVPILAVEPLPLSTCPVQEDGCTTYIAVTAQIPFEILATNPDVPLGVLIPRTQILFSDAVNGRSASIELLPFVDEVHIINSCDLLLPNPTLPCVPVATHGDGSLITQANPAKAGEQIVLYAFGVGPTKPLIPTGQATPEHAPAALSYAVSFDARTNGSPSRPFVPTRDDGLTVVRPSYIGLTPGYAGLYQINVPVPALPDDARPCSTPGTSFPSGARVDSNLTINIGGPSSFAGAAICVDTGNAIL